MVRKRAQPVIDRTQFEFHNLQTGRHWTLDSIDELIVGRMYGGYDITQILRYVTSNNASLAGITAAELDVFWNNVLMDPTTPHMVHWMRMDRNGPEVQAVLDRIRTSLMQVTVVLE